MKVVKLILNLLAILLLVFLVRGLMTSSVNYTSEITVDKSVQEAWAVMNDESKIHDWLEGITDMKHVSGTKGEVGAITEYTFNQGGQESTVIETIKSITPDKQIQMDFDAPGAMTMNYQVDFNERDGKTHIKSTTDVTGQGFIMKCLIPWIKGSMLTQEDSNFAKLKKLINENTTNYFREPVIESVLGEVEEDGE